MLSSIGALVWPSVVCQEGISLNYVVISTCAGAGFIPSLNKKHSTNGGYPPMATRKVGSGVIRACSDAWSHPRRAVGKLLCSTTTKPACII